MNSFDTLVTVTIVGALVVWVLIESHRARARINNPPAPKPRTVFTPPSPRIREGDRVRILVHIPERNIEPGTEGRVRFVYPGDDLEFYIVVQGVDGAVMFLQDELWQLEVLR